MWTFPKYLQIEDISLCFQIQNPKIVQCPSVLHARVDNKDPCPQTKHSCHKILMCTFCENNAHCLNFPSVVTTLMSLEGLHLCVHIYTYLLFGSVLVATLTWNFFRMHVYRIPAKQSSHVPHLQGWAREACPPPLWQIAGTFHQKHVWQLHWTCPWQYSTRGRAPQHTQILCNIRLLPYPGHWGGTDLPTPLWSMSLACMSKTHIVNVGFELDCYMGSIQKVEECSGNSYIKRFLWGEICPIWGYLCCWFACAARRPDDTPSSPSCSILHTQINVSSLEVANFFIAHQYCIQHMCNPPRMCCTNSTI